MEPGFRVKPQPEPPLSEAPESPQEWIDLALRLRDEQGVLPKQTRVHIGGELVAVVMQNRGITATKVFRFEDFDETWGTMNEVRDV
jgi:hypothetical protein